MVALREAVASNQRIAATFPKGLVAVFVGGTSGVGEYTVKAFAKYTRNSRAYIIGRSKPNATRIVAECCALGPSNSFEFIQADISLLKTVDDVCRQIRTKETAINILFQTQGSMAFQAVTSEGLSLAAALGIHSRNRFLLNLLPLLQRATTLKRVVCVMAATCEGPIDLDNLGGVGFSLFRRRDQLAAVQTLLLEKVQETVAGAAPVGFVHDVPGVVQSGITRDAEGVGMKVLIGVTSLLGPLIRTPIDECAEMHLFYATSARFASSAGGVASDGVPLQNGLGTARGSIGKTGSGVYTINTKGEPSPPRVEEVLAGHRNDGTATKLWDIVLAESKKITGSEWLA
ncbi:hypothetical protein HMPREF1624_04214 [Sporothrix schenckii ATCC 58251]|uniref:Ketoreductase (KR) domain-containing protein n=1 Tax=Sporothrix schenckii (strain ATCC 58251 / de Perez 2211183) TaxID=1391915 RepID=U7PWA4_SPOS1|nr:hypothetical protein HMPREF1624_04214 [Sporothrix schenckii ATCC 58251]